MKRNYFVLASIFVVGVTYIVATALVSSYQIVWLYIPHFDKLLHVGGGVIAAIFIISVLNEKFGESRNLKRLAMVLALVLVVGVLWELAERLSSIFGPAYWPVLGRYFYGSDLSDTMVDLVSDLVGAFLYFLITLL